MTITALKCPNCAAPIPPSRTSSVVCAYCSHVLTGVPSVDLDASDRDEDNNRPRVTVADTRFVLEGRLGLGDGTEVFLARRDAKLTERVVLKVLRTDTDADLLSREWRTLEALFADRSQGSDYFSTLLPQPVTHGRLIGPHTAEVPVNVYRWRSGFVHTLADVRRQYPDGIDPRAAVWIYKRLLEVLGWVHRAGYVHGAILPQHSLVHARDHGVVLIGWSSATRDGTPLPSVSVSSRAFYTDSAWSGLPVTPATDITQCTRAVLFALGADSSLSKIPASVPKPFATLLSQRLDPDVNARDPDAWALMKQVTSTAKDSFGPARYVPFSMPGW